MCVPGFVYWCFRSVNRFFLQVFSRLGRRTQIHRRRGTSGIGCTRRMIAPNSQTSVVVHVDIGVKEEEAGAREGEEKEREREREREEGGEESGGRTSG